MFKSNLYNNIMSRNDFSEIMFEFKLLGGVARNTYTYTQKTGCTPE